MILSIILLFVMSAVYVDVSPAPPVTSKPVKSTQTTLVDSKNVKEKAPAKKQKPLPRRNTTPSIPKPPITVKVDSPFIKQLNKVRQQHNLNPLRENQQLNAQSQAWANQMQEGGPPHSGYPGEVTAYSCPDRSDPLQLWLNSPAHYNIIMGDYNSIGYGEVKKGDCYYFVAQVV